MAEYEACPAWAGSYPPFFAFLAARTAPFVVLPFKGGFEVGGGESSSMTIISLGTPFL